MPITWPPADLLEKRLREIFPDNPGGAPPSDPPCVVEWQGAAFRSATQRYASEETFTDGEGARRNGGRFTPRGSFATVYLSVDERTAAAELQGIREYYSLPASTFEPRVLAAVSVSVGLMLDLTHPGTLNRLGITIAHLHMDWRYVSDKGRDCEVQTFGLLVRRVGYEGMLVPSLYRPEGFNLVLFPDNFRDGSHAVMISPDES